VILSLQDDLVIGPLVPILIWISEAAAAST